jgi:hypothetical protein
VTCAGRFKPLKASQAIVKGSAGVAAKAAAPVHAAKQAVSQGVKMLRMGCLLLGAENEGAFRNA